MSKELDALDCWAGQGGEFFGNKNLMIKWMVAIDDSVADLRTRLDALEKKIADEGNIVGQYIDNELEQDKRLDALESLHYKGVAPIDEKGYHNWPEPDRPLTCGTCKKAWRRPEREDFFCFDAPACCVTNHEKPIWLLPSSEACPNHDPMEAA